MSTLPARERVIVSFLVVGALVMMGAATVYLVTGEPVWRFLVGVGGVLHFTGWVLDIRPGRQRGGAR
ncbi:hypothetical protein [Streptomyces sp. NPDC029674]|uniref:hypothetical protein n=1 Tax=Streptomyces sp. NPDC029674 TaxID=3365297 RepID=UPI00385106B4